MPIYEYACEKCGKRIERIQKVSDPSCKKCPHCGGPLRKLVSSSAIQFKGSGFYITDYAKKGRPSAEAKKNSTPKSTAEKAVESLPKTTPGSE
ncbi:MAG: zinc ribbon domain-containing protein [Candidatus Aminicenantes bacterium]|nr:zinc ribbon domain-containing protein [Candidatus Aminicenantes bacterium]